MKYHKMVENAVKPQGFWGKMMIWSMNSGHSKMTDWALCHLDIKSNDFIVDVGCGGGKTVSKLCNKIGNGKVFGIDYSPLCVKEARKLNENNILCEKARILQGVAEELPFEDGFIDIVTAVETYYFWKDKLGVLKEIFRILKSSGKIMLVFEMLKTDDDPKKWEKVENALSIKAVSKSEIEDMLMRAGFQNVKLYTKSGKSWLCAAAEKP